MPFSSDRVDGRSDGSVCPLGDLPVVRRSRLVQRIDRPSQGNLSLGKYDVGGLLPNLGVRREEHGHSRLMGEANESEVTLKNNDLRG